MRMATENVNVRVRGELRTHLDQQIGEHGLYENASEYVRDLIRQDMKSREEAWQWLGKSIEPGLRADESAFIEVSAADVVKRNRGK